MADPPVPEGWELVDGRLRRELRFADFSAAEEYWARTGPFWADVRAAWREIYREHDAFRLAEEVDGVELFVPMFQYAEALAAGERYDADASRRFVRETLERYVEPL